MPTYREINAAWPQPTPIPTGAEAIRGVRRLIRRAFALAKADGAIGYAGYGPYMKRIKFKLTSGRRYTYVRNFVWYVNPNEHRFGGQGGWAEIVHSVSHWAQRRFWPKEHPHSPRHVWLEQELAAYAIANFLAGQLARPERPKVDRVTARAASVDRRIQAWTTKLRRAQTALRTLQRQKRYYARTRTG